MSKIHEQYGLLTEQFAMQQANTAQLFEILKELKSGKLKLKQLTIKGNNWEIEPDEPMPKGKSVKKKPPHKSR